VRKVSIAQKLLIFVVIFTIYAVLPLPLSNPYYLRVLNLLVLFTLFTISSNIIFGHTRQLFLCHGALIGIGAYTSVLLPKSLAIPPWIVIPLGALFSACIGSSISTISSLRRLSIILMAVFTLSFQIIFGEVIVGLREITGGDEGLILRQDLIRLPSTVNRELFYYYVFVFLLFVSIIVYNRIVNSHIGVAFKCIVEDEIAASSVGIDVIKYKVLSAFIGSFILGLAGGVYAYYNLYISPSLFNLDLCILVMLVFGGMGTLAGPLLGAGIFTQVFEFLRPMGPITTLIFGLLLIVLFLYFREGLVAWLRRLPTLYRAGGRPSVE